MTTEDFWKKIKEESGREPLVFEVTGEQLKEILASGKGLPTELFKQFKQHNDKTPKNSNEPSYFSLYIQTLNALQETQELVRVQAEMIERLTGRK